MKKSKIKNVKVMIGSGEHAMFINVPKGKKVKLMKVGMTFSEARHHLEEKENRLIEDIERKQEKNNIKRRILTLFKRNNQTKF